MTNKTWIEQAGTVPFQFRDDTLEFCLITSSRTRRWGFPKGIIDPGDTAPSTALKESHEEAGLQGRIIGAPLGDYHYEKWGRTLHVTVFLMEVSHAADVWEESAWRDRCWATEDHAAELLADTKPAEFLHTALARIHAELP